MKIILLILLSLLCMINAYAQSNRPPWILGTPPSWVPGELPEVELWGNVMKVVTGEGATTDEALANAKYNLLSELIMASKWQNLKYNDFQREAVDSQAIYQGRKLRHDSSVTKNYAEEIKIDGEVFVRYSLLDSYVQIKGGRYYFAGLFLIAQNGMTLASVPPITYAMDRGAWRSLIVPGWAQFYQGRTGAGIAFLGTEAALIGTTVFFQTKVNHNLQLINGATSIEVKQAYKQRYDQMSLYRNISAGACVAWYAFNAIDAFTSKKGKLYYTTAYGSRTFSFAPTPITLPTEDGVGIGLTCNVKF